MGENDYMWVAMLKLPECGYLQRDGYDEKPRHSFIIIVVHGHQQAASSSRKLYLCLKGDNKQDTLIGSRWARQSMTTVSAVLSDP